MRRFEHGGDVYAHPGCTDFSASLNPLGMPQGAREVLRENVDAFASYPDPECRELTDALAEFERVPRPWVLACAGATDAFARICAAIRPQEAVVCAPSYSGYEQALEQVGATIHRHALSDSDGFVMRRMCSLADKDLAFVANPNNPTGRCVELEALAECLDHARECGTLVVLDECFIDLTQRQGSNDLLGAYPNLVLVKALTKTFALAGLRVGYVLSSNEDLICRLRKMGQPWAVSVPAQLAGVACLRDGDYLVRSRCLIAQERGVMLESMRALGLRVIPAEANFLLFCGPPELDERLLSKGVLIRCCDNFWGLDDSWYRVAVRTRRENELLLKELREVLA